MSSKSLSTDMPIRLCYNENPLGASRLAIEAAQTALARLHRYPSRDARLLKEAIANAYRLPVETIFCENGSEAILRLLIRTYVKPQDKMLCPQYSFITHQMVGWLSDVTQMVLIPQEAPAFKLSVEAIVSRVTPAVKMVCLDNPGNPIGHYYTSDEIAALAKQLPSDVLLVLDHAYIDFMHDNLYQDAYQWVSQCSNVVMVHTFSKMHGLAGLRLGWLYASENVIETLKTVSLPFHINGISQASGIAALNDHTHQAKTREHIQYWKMWLIEQLTAVGLEIGPSCSNFVLIRVPNVFSKTAYQMQQLLEKEGILVRHLASYHLPDYLRISIGLERDMTALVSVINKER